MNKNSKNGQIETQPHDEPDTLSLLQIHCREVWWSSRRLPSGRQVQADLRRTMTTVAEGQSSGFSISKRIFTSDHPAVKALNEAFRSFDALRDELTIVKGATGGSEKEIEAGHRVIRVVDIDEFEQRFKALRIDLTEKVDQVINCLDQQQIFDGKVALSIKEMDQKKLGRAFNEKDYPTTEYLKKHLGVTMPQYGTFTVDVKLPKEVVDRESRRVRDELQTTITTATTRIAEDLIEAFEVLGRQLTTRTRIYPAPDHPMANRDGAEVVKVIFNKHDRDIPAGQLKLQLAWRSPDPGAPVGSDKTIRMEDTFGPFTQEEYESQIRPRDTDERRQLRESVLANLMDRINSVSRIKQMLGEDGTALDVALDKIRTVLENCGSDKGVKELAKTIRDNEPMAKTLAGVLQETLTEVAATAEKSRESRRLIDREMISIAAA